MKIYTKTGDDGTTGLLGPGRFLKDDPRIEAYGTVDELNASIGIVQAILPQHASLSEILTVVQNDLFVVGAILADPSPDGRFSDAIDYRQIARLEAWIDTMEATLPPLTQFVLPGGTSIAAVLHMARTICRRAERSVVHLTRTPTGQIRSEVLIYLNRLSDLLFVMARAANLSAGVPDKPWAGISTHLHRTEGGEHA